MANMELQMLIKAQNSAEKQIQQVQKQLKDVTKTMEKQQSVSKKTASVFQSSWLKSAVSIYSVWRAVKSVTLAYMEDERAIRRLETLMKNVKGTTDAHIESLKEQARAMQQVTTIGDDVVMTGQSQLATFQLQTSTIQTLTPALLDLAVAVYGVNVNQQDMINVSNLLGKAIMGQTGALTRYGITMNETQVKVLQTGTEMQKASAMVEILQQNFGGLSTEMRNTLEGRLEVVKNQFSDLKEEIGMKFAPVITSLLIWLSDVGFPAVSRAINFLSEAWGSDMFYIRSITETTGWIIKTTISGWAQAIDLIAQGLSKLGNNKTLKNFTPSGIANNLEAIIKNVPVSQIEQEQGQVKRESGDISSQLDKVFGTGGGGSGDKFNADAQAKMDKYQELLKGIGGGGAGGAGGAGTDNANKAVEQANKLQEELATRLGKSRQAWRDMVKDAKEAMANLEQAHKTRIAEIDKGLADLMTSLEELKTTYNATIAGLDMSTAEQVIAQEQKIKDLQNEINEARASGEDTGALEKQLQNEDQALKRFMASSTGLEDELTEVRRRNALTDFERFIEDQDAKRMKTDEDFETRKGQIEAEMQVLEDQRTRENEIFEAKRNEYLTTLDTFNEFKTGYIDGLMQMEVRTETSLKILEARLGSLKRTLAEIESTQSSISEAQSGGGETSSGSRAFGGFAMPGKLYKVNEREDEYFRPNTAGQIVAPSQNNSTSININVTASPGMDESRLAKAIKAEIQNLARSMKLKTLGVPSTT